MRKYILRSDSTDLPLSASGSYDATSTFVDQLIKLAHFAPTNQDGYGRRLSQVRLYVDYCFGTMVYLIGILAIVILSLLAA